MAIDPVFNQPFDEQVAFFRQKLNLPSEHWDDILRQGHDRGFIVSGAMKADLITDLRVAVDQAISEGKSLGWFRDQFKGIVEKHGWDYTGDFKWRTKVIYETNMRSSYAAGRERQMNDPELLQIMPYWRYVHNDSVMHPRPLHQLWNGIILPASDPWWKTHSAPNGWGCKCRKVPVSEWQMKKKYGKESPDSAPDNGSYTFVDRDGVAHQIPNGIDYGWDYTPGKTWFPDLDKYDPALARQMVAENMRDGVFERWVSKLETQAANQLALPEYQGITKDKKLSKLRSAIETGEKYPVAVLGEEYRKLIGAKSQSVWLSDDTLIKQAVSRQGQSIVAGDYLMVQDTIEAAQLIIQDGDFTLAFIRHEDKVYQAVVKSTQTGKRLFLVSFRETNVVDAERMMTKGKVLKNEL